jgi:hypothetical protein
MERSTEGTKTTGRARHRVAVTRHHARWRTRTRRESGVATEHGDAGSVLGATERNHVLANVAADDLTVLGTAIGQDVLHEVVSELVAGDYEESVKALIRSDARDLLSMSGIRGRSWRPSQTRSRYRSRNSLPPIFKHFSMTFEAYWSMLYSVAKRKIWSTARLRSAGAPCSQMC